MGFETWSEWDSDSDEPKHCRSCGYGGGHDWACPNATWEDRMGEFWGRVHERCTEAMFMYDMFGDPWGPKPEEVLDYARCRRIAEYIESRWRRDRPIEVEVHVATDEMPF